MGVYDDRGVRKKSGKKKRARKACFHCRQSHLSCGDCRPCPRCTKKGLNCVDSAPTHKVSKRAARSPSPASDDQEYSPTSPVVQQQQEPVYQQPQYRDPFPLETSPTDEIFYSSLFSPSTPLYTTLPVERFDTTMTNSMSVLAEELRQLRGLVSQQQHMINRLATRVEPDDSYDSQVQNSPVSHASGSEDKIEKLAYYMNNIVPNLTSIMLCVCDRRTREILAYNKAFEDQMKIKASGREMHTIYDLDHPDMRSYMKDLLDAALQSVPHYREPIVRVLTTNAMLVDCTGSVIPVRTTIHVESDIFWLEYVKISQNLVMDDSFELNGRVYPKRTEVSSMFDLISKITFITSTIEQEKANAVVKYL